MNGWEECSRRLAAAGAHPVVTAALLGFGFVFIHPFEDGNGRLHRFLIHHALAVGRFTPEGVIFPVSAVMLRERASYDASLESYSREVMPLVEYELDDAGMLTVLNETALHYRYPDLTQVTEELFVFIRDTIDREFTAELEYLAVFDAARRQLAEIVDMPDSRLDLFIRLCVQGRGRLSRNKRARFDELTDDEIGAAGGGRAGRACEAHQPGLRQGVGGDLRRGGRCEMKACLPRGRSVAIGHPWMSASRVPPATHITVRRSR